MAFNRSPRRAVPRATVRPATAGAAALRVPACIEQTAGQLGARFERMPQQVTQNLDAGPAQVRTYLGTYMPRTVVEFQTIGQELLTLAAVREGLGVLFT